MMLKKNYHSHKTSDLLSSRDKFYFSSNYENYVHLDIVHYPFDCKNIVHRDKRLDMIQGLRMIQ
jgi:hypothetical protein